MGTGHFCTSDTFARASLLHEGTLLHEDTFARRVPFARGDTFALGVTFARRLFCTRIDFARGYTFARRPFCKRGHLCTATFLHGQNISRQYFRSTILMHDVTFLRRHFCNAYFGTMTFCTEHPFSYRLIKCILASTKSVT